MLETWEGGRDPGKKKRTTAIMTNTENVIGGGRRHLLLHYWYKVSVLHIVKYNLIGGW